MRHVVVLTGAGISSESGLATFRGAGGLWEGHNVYEVATPEAWQRDPDLVLRFYNSRRQQLRQVEPNAAHRALVRLEEHFNVTIVTQNVDDLHERAGSSSIIHLHGELLKARSTADASVVIELGEKDIEPGDLCPLGSQLRPHIVWFGEAVPEMGHAMEVVRSCDILMIVGTSLQVYPAAGLAQMAVRAGRPYVVDPVIPAGVSDDAFIPVAKSAVVGVPELVDQLIARQK
ncbi:MAG: NAD-dependent deacetylase [Puniceicoccaceae bacterium]